MNASKQLMSRRILHFCQAFRTLSTEQSISSGANPKFGNLISRHDNEAYQKALTESLKHPDYFNVSELITMKDLFEVRAHLGHKYTMTNPFMKEYIFGNRFNQAIINLEHTVPLVKEALNFVAHVAFRNGIIVFIGCNQLHQQLIEQTAENVGEYSHTKPFSRTEFLSPETHGNGKFVRSPDCVIFIDTNNRNEQHRAVESCAQMLIPSIGLVDTDCDPRLISYPIPSNDDSLVTVKYFCQLFERSILKGKQKVRDILGAE